MKTQLGILLKHFWTLGLSHAVDPHGLRKSSSGTRTATSGDGGAAVDRLTQHPGESGQGDTLRHLHGVSRFSIYFFSVCFFSVFFRPFLALKFPVLTVSRVERFGHSRASHLALISFILAKF